MIDRKKVVAMARTGFRIKQIASRLQCSEKQVSRILKQYGVQPTGDADIFLGDPDLEGVFISATVKVEGSFSAAADRFGVSRQAIWEKINNFE